MAEQTPQKVSRIRSSWMLLIAAIALVLLSAVVYLMARTPGETGEKQALRIGYQNSPAMALIMVAQDREFFQQAGVDVSLRDFTAGKFALQAFLGGSLDVAVAGDVPIGLALLQGQRLVAFAEVIRDSEDEMRMVVRRSGACDRNGAARYFLNGPRRKIATSFGGGPEWFTVTFLRSAGVPLNRVELVSQSPTEMAGAVSGGDVDGIAIFDPAATTAETMLGEAGCTFADPRAYRQHYAAVTRPELMQGPDPRLVRFVQALRLAERFIAAHPAEAQAIVQRKTAIDPRVLAALWPKLNFGVALDRDLPRLWMHQEEYHRSKPGASFPAAGPDFRAAVSDRAFR